MYRVPDAAGHPEDEGFHFGDVIDQPWFFDLRLTSDTKHLSHQPEPKCPELRGYFPVARDMVKKERPAPRDVVIAHAHVIETASRGVIVSDECDIEDVKRYGRGRLRLAALVDIGDGERDMWVKKTSFSHVYVPGQPELKPVLREGRIDFNSIVTVDAADLFAIRPSHVIAAEDKKRDLQIRWAAHSTRHGPAVVAQAALDLAILVTTGGDLAKIEALKEAIRKANTSADPVEEWEKIAFDPAGKALIEPLKALAVTAWTFEGPIVDGISDAVEAGTSPVGVIDDAIRTLEEMRARVDDVLEALRKVG